MVYRLLMEGMSLIKPCVCHMRKFKLHLFSLHAPVVLVSCVAFANSAGSTSLTVLRSATRLF
jgi:hypothetical protein